MDLKRVNKINQKHKDIVNGFTNEVQQKLPDDNSYFNIVDMIKHMILLYYYHDQLFETNILTNQEQEELIELFKSNGKLIIDYPWISLYRSKEDGLSRENFVDKVHNKQFILLLIKLGQKCIIGGYTKVGWKTKQKHQPYDYTTDENAFLFHLKSEKDDKPFISNIEKDKISTAIGNHPNFYGCFGDTYLIYFGDDHFHQQHNGSWNSFEKFENGSDYITGNTVHATVYESNVELEVFQVEM